MKEPKTADAADRKLPLWLAWAKLIPNILTSFRVLLVPFFVLLLVEPSPARDVWAIIIFVVASVTDWIDGYLARVFNAHSVIGKLLDPLADKILVMAALVMLAGTTPMPRIPAWIAVVLLSREMIITGLRSLAAVYGLVVPAGRWAKHKTAWMMLAIPFLILDRPIEFMGVAFDFHKAGLVFLYIALAYSIFTGLAYAYHLRSLFAMEQKDGQVGEIIT